MANEETLGQEQEKPKGRGLLGGLVGLIGSALGISIYAKGKADKGIENILVSNTKEINEKYFAEKANFGKVVEEVAKDKKITVDELRNVASSNAHELKHGLIKNKNVYEKAVNGIADQAVYSELAKNATTARNEVAGKASDALKDLIGNKKTASQTLKDARSTLGGIADGADKTVATKAVEDAKTAFKTATEELKKNADYKKLLQEKRAAGGKVFSEKAAELSKNVTDEAKNAAKTARDAADKVLHDGVGKKLTETVTSVKDKLGSFEKAKIGFNSLSGKQKMVAGGIGLLVIGGTAYLGSKLLRGKETPKALDVEMQRQEAAQAAALGGGAPALA